MPHPDAAGHPSVTVRPARLHLQICGVVQGVGFRPFVFQTAQALGLNGWVRNTASGVELELQGMEPALQEFIERLHTQPPPLAHILDVAVTRLPPTTRLPAGLHIRASRAAQSEQRTLISPDVAICPACRREIMDTTERRHAYPFTNCTHCGPRFTIITDLPYDRPLTTMAGFTLCPACAAEYRDSADRRFHAQPIACPTCGPEITFIDAAGSAGPTAQPALMELAARLQQGQIIGIQGLGGFHLACRADLPEAVTRLRQAKARPHKPLALMVRDLDMAGQIGVVSPAEAALLSRQEAPIVLLRRREACEIAALELVSPQNGYVGVMLPYTPLHQLLMQALKRPLVMTSGNPPGEPLVIEIQAARDKLLPLGDGLLAHNRPIRRRCDDSVMFVAHLPDQAAPQFIRRSRGYAPLPVLLPAGLSLPVPLLATGGDLKNVAALGVERTIFLTQHIGDLSHLDTRTELARTVADFEHLFRIRPKVVVCDLHPDYAARRYAQQRAAAEGLTLIEIQHHHAHIAGCSAENGLTTPVIGLAFDGTGYGPDGHIWGGEVLLADLHTFERLLHLEYLPLPGGDAATRRPYRIALAYLARLCPDLDAEALFPDIPVAEIRLIQQMVAQGVNTPLTSSLGRLFDAVSALLGLTRNASHEAQAAIALENAALGGQATRPYAMPLDGDIIRLEPLLRAIVADRQARLPVPDIARRFHLSVAHLAVAAAAHARATRCAATRAPVALSGGVWQNRLLLEMSLPCLQADGFNVLLHRQTPANDGGLAYGQAVIAAARLTTEAADE